MTSDPPTVIQWVLDTRNLWPEASETKNLPSVAPRIFNLLTPSERETILRYYFVRDAKLALGSILLKRHVLSTHLGIPWDSISITRDKRTKPVFVLPDGSEPLIFNVTHQAGLVALLGVKNPPEPRARDDAAESNAGFAIGVDIVAPLERRVRDHDMINGEGWGHFVDVHDEVFSPGETAALKAMGEDKDTKLAYFYALWCLREAYVKMTGEALLANWLKELDMRGFAPPGRDPLCADGKPRGDDGATFEMFMKGKKVEDVEMVLQPLLEEYMICASVRRTKDGKTIELGNWENLDINELLEKVEKSR